MYANWQIYSFEDPRFNISGYDFVTLYDGLPKSAKKKLKNIQSNLGIEPPSDLMFEAVQSELN
jgi:hypothetical protein